jgi:diaminopimelate epimerase
MDFRKYEGLGNDFVVVDVEDAESFDVEQARRICDRHFGVGADGVLCVAPPKSSAALATMVVINADGSRPEMCGNGLRCVALHLASRDAAAPGSALDSEFIVDTDAGPKPCRVRRPSGGVNNVAEVSIDIGEARVEGELLIEHAGTRYALTRVSTGNPHAVLFDPNLDEALVPDFVKAVNAATPGGVNVEFVRELGPQRFSVVVWERGVGRTLACGTGAVASVAAAVVAGRAAAGREAEVELPGGSLFIQSVGNGPAGLRGPAREVFRGVLS